MPGEASVPSSRNHVVAVAHDPAQVRDRLDVVDERRRRPSTRWSARPAPSAPRSCRLRHPARRPGRPRPTSERRVDARERESPVQGLEQPRLLAVEVLGRTAEHLEGHAARPARRPHGRDRLVQTRALAAERLLHREDDPRRAHGVRGDQRALDDAVRVDAHEGAVLEGSGLALGAVDDDGRRLGRAAGVLVHGAPLATGREPGAAPAPESRTRRRARSPFRARRPGPRRRRCRRRWPGRRPGTRPGRGRALVRPRGRQRRASVRRSSRPRRRGACSLPPVRGARPPARDDTPPRRAPPVPGARATRAGPRRGPRHHGASRCSVATPGCSRTVAMIRSVPSRSPSR